MYESYDVPTKEAEQKAEALGRKTSFQKTVVILCSHPPPTDAFFFSILFLKSKLPDRTGALTEETSLLR